MTTVTIRLGPYDDRISVLALAEQLDAASRPLEVRRTSLTPNSYSPEMYDLMVRSWQGDSENGKRRVEFVGELISEMSVFFPVLRESTVHFSDLAKWVLGRRNLGRTGLSRLLSGSDVLFQQDGDDWQTAIDSARQLRREGSERPGLPILKQEVDPNKYGPKLTDEDRKEILNSLERGETQTALATRYGVSRTTIGKVVKEAQNKAKSKAHSANAFPFRTY